MSTRPLSDWMVWQLADSAFPTGAFSHSYGLEAAHQLGEVVDAPGLTRFLRASLWQAGHAVLPLVNAAHRAPDRFAELDGLADVFLTNRVANRASRTQGRTLAATCARVWPLESLTGFDRTVRRSHAHVAPVTGVALRCLGAPLPVVQRLVLFVTARGVLSAAVRLGLAGSYEAQHLLAEGGPDLDAVLERCSEFDERDLAQAAPLIDVLQAGHERLYTRLFQS